jgi:hypothetical protein
MPLIIAFILTFFSPQAVATPRLACQTIMHETLDLADKLGKDWEFSQLLLLEEECDDTKEMRYWRAVNLIERFQYIGAKKLLLDLQTNLNKLPASHWLHRWVNIRLYQLNYYGNSIARSEYQTLTSLYSRFHEVTKFVNKTMEYKNKYDLMSSEMGDGAVYDSVMFHVFEKNDSLFKAIKNQIDDLRSNTPLFDMALNKTQIIVAKDKKQYENWVGNKGTAAVLGMTPHWATREFVLVINSEDILMGNITLIHELLHVFVRLNPDISKRILNFRHFNGHYKNPKVTSEHIFVYGAQFYLTGFSNAYKRLWPGMYYLLQEVFSDNVLSPSHISKEWVFYVIEQDQQNFTVF